MFCVCLFFTSMWLPAAWKIQTNRLYPFAVAAIYDPNCRGGGGGGAGSAGMGLPLAPQAAAVGAAAAGAVAVETAKTNKSNGNR